jgi:excinuclease ABC subunit A
MSIDLAMPPARRADVISIRGARTHNLKGVDLDIPHWRLVVITGLSGSGKSSLAFDTLLAEGQRQYIESLSAYARQFFDQLERPDLDVIEGLQPTIAIDQRPSTTNPRSTVATVTEIYDYLRVLMARTGEAACPQCGTAISQQTPAEIQAAILALPEQTKAMLLAPMVRGRKGKHADVMERIRKEGFVRVRIDGLTYELEQAPELSARERHDIDAVVDRVIIRPGLENRLAESVRLALKHGEGALRVSFLTPEAKTSANGSSTKESTAENGWEERVYNTQYACPDCKASLAEIEPRTFSFNSPYGACAACDGLGVVEGTIPDDGAPAENGAAAEGTRVSERLGNALRGLVACAECGGSRLRPEARAVRLGGKAIHEITGLSVDGADEFFRGLVFAPSLEPVGRPPTAEIVRRLEFLRQVGLRYLTLDRASDSLSGGELQRVRLATGIGSGLVGVLYILDEPSIGLHPRDNERLVESLRRLVEQGNTVLVVEHDEAIIRAADWLIDVGPGAGERGGRIVAEGTPEEVAANPESITGGYLSGRLRIEVPHQRRKAAKTRMLELEGATLHNLRDVDAAIPLGLLTCVTGVSGSGKSSLVIDTLAAALARKLNAAATRPGPYRALRGVAKLERMIHVDQSPIGRSPRSNPATYTGVFDDIRRVFAGTKHAKQLGYKSGRFSFNAKSGRCEHCQGQGVERIEMRFLPDLFVTCPVCHGRQFNRQTLAVRYRDKSIADVLAMNVDEAAAFFENHPSIHRMLTSLVDVGLGYLTLGQRSTTLSGGEAQRIKLAAELGRPSTGATLYILDEPTTGLHVDDIGRLLAVLQQLVELGHTVLVIEHNLEVIKSADWVIDMGPEGGAAGGAIVAAGTPEEVAGCAGSYTGRWLKDHLNDEFPNDE